MIGISGIAGRFPNSDNIDDFWKKLCNGTDLITTNNRIPFNYKNIPNRIGQIKNADRFDNLFFKINEKHSYHLDPQIRHSLEVVYECIIDADLDIDKLNKSNTGVYIGGCFSDHSLVLLNNINNINGYEIQGTSTNMFANKISYYFNLKGPSFCVNTACSSSLTALTLAYNAIQSGEIDRAFVGGISFISSPSISKSFNEFKMLSPNGICYSFDEKANGYVRTDCIGFVLLEKNPQNFYLEILNSGINCDGYKKEGITYPGFESQLELYKKVFHNINVDEIEYIECHGTGTVVGDTIEIKTLDNIFKNTKLIGSIKSNMGHAEGASGIASLIKMCLAYKYGLLPANLHYKKTNHIPILEKKFNIVTKTQTWNKGKSCINNFGFGGSNALVILQSGNKLIEKDNISKYQFGRSEDLLMNNIPNASYDIIKFPYRNINNITRKIEFKPKIAFCYTGQGCQWNFMGRELWLKEPIFKNIILESCYDIDVNIDKLFIDGDLWENKFFSGFGITLIQIGITELLKVKYNILPDYIFGHSIGEVACSFADNCLTAKETAYLSYIRCMLLEKIESYGLMISVGLSIEKCYELIENYKNIFVACDNAPDNCTLSGNKEEILEIITILKSNNIFVKIIETDGIAYHSIFFKQNEEKIILEFNKVIKNSLKRSLKWISTSSNDIECNSIYYAKNVIGCVEFRTSLLKLPEKCLVIEIGPNNLLKSLIKRNREDIYYLPSLIKNKNDNECIQELIDELWLYGFNIDTHNYTNKLINWNHKKIHFIPDYKMFDTSSETIMTYNIEEYKFLLDHKINNKSLFPAMGHCYTIWKFFGLDKKIKMENLKIYKAIIIDNIDKIIFKIKNYKDLYEIYYENELVADAICNENKENLIVENINILGSYQTKKEFYQNISIYGYDYENTFQIIEKRNINHIQFNKKYTHWICYLDGILQIIDIDNLYLPIKIEKILINHTVLEEMSEHLFYNQNSVYNFQLHVSGLIKKHIPKKIIYPITNAVKYIHYGEHIDNTELDYKKYYMNLGVTLFNNILTKKDEYLFIKNIKEKIDKYYIDFNIKNIKDKEIYFGKKILEKIYKNINLDNIYLKLSLLEEYNDFYYKDPINNFNLNIIVQILYENLGDSYSVFEIGSGTGGFTRQIFPLIKNNVISYICSDISSINLVDKSIETLKYDINDNWTGKKFDLVCASNSLHLSKNLNNGLENVCNILNEDGFLLLFESTSIIQLPLFGLSDFAWNTANDHREYGLWTSKDHWLRLFKEHNLEPCYYITDSCEINSLFLCRKKNINNNNIIIEEDIKGNVGFIKSLRKEGKNIKFSTKNINYPLIININNGSYYQVPLEINTINNNGYHLSIIEEGNLDSLTWKFNTEIPNIKVQYCGLNFRDIMLSYGKLYNNNKTIGLEFSGYLNNKRVIGISEKSLATHIYCPDFLLWELPDYYSLEEGATIPIVYSTVYYALVIKANIKKGDSILIHSIAGGVGMAAYHIAKNRGANIYGTCSKDKYKFMKNNFENIIELFDSHSENFKDQLLRLTNYEGVNIVLNSLSEKKLLLSLECVKKFGHFCEIGKYDIQEDNKIGLKIFSKNISFHGIDLSDIFTIPSVWKQIYDMVKIGLDKKEIIALNLTKYDNVKDAMKLLSSGKHVGKIIIDIENIKNIPILPVYKTYGTHLVIGGLGGFGFELVKWLNTKGAEKIIIISRSNPKTEYQKYILNKLNILVYIEDFIYYDNVELFINNIENLTGIWHLGMVLNDSLYDNMLEKEWNETIDVKSTICLNIDKVLRKYNINIKNFVAFSSVVSLYGNIGQTNYAYGNSYIEEIMRKRYDDNLPGLAIQWGPIDNVGTFLNDKNIDKNIYKNFDYFIKQNINNCLDTLEKLLFSKSAVVTSYIYKSIYTDIFIKEDNLLICICKNLGVNINNLNDTYTLIDLGMDSLQSIQIQNIFRSKQIIISLDNIKNLTIGEIKKMF